MLSCYPRLLRFRIERNIHCTNKTYFEPCVEPLRNSYEVSNLAFLNCSVLHISPSVRRSISNLTLILNTFPLSDYQPVRWNFLHRFILKWHLWRLHFFSSKFPPLPRILPLPPKTFPLFLNTFPLSNLEEFILGCHLWRLHFVKCKYVSKFMLNKSHTSGYGIYFFISKCWHLKTHIE